MAGPRTQPYFRGDDLPPAGFLWKVQGQPLDLSDPDWEIVARIGTRSEPALVELTSVTGADASSDPNVVISFADGDLDPLPIGLADGVIIATRNALAETMPFEMPIHRTIEPPAPPGP
jgi:hypothetical protein